MTAAKLREAATLLRERAEAATPGPWEVSRNGALVCADHPQVADTYRVVAKADDAWIDYRSNAAYIATMSPTVALALADWLDINADYEDAGENARDEFLAALAVADAILGVTS